MILFVILAAMFGVMAATRTWTPKLGLDLRGGTTITLTASNTAGGGAPSSESLEQARTIIQQRVDSLGVGESEVTTSGDRQVVVTVPNVQQDELVRMVGQTAVLTFRAVYHVEAVQPPLPDPGSPEPGAGEPGADATVAPGEQAPGEEQPADDPAADPTAGANRPAPMLPTAPPPPRTPRPTEPGQGLPPEQATTWQPTENDFVDFTEYECGEEIPDISDQPLVACDRTGTEKYLLGPAMITGDRLTTASAGVPQNQLNWVVNLEFDGQGATMFEQATGALAANQDPQNRFAIVLDGRVISAPSVSQSIPGGRAEISGSFNERSATELSNVLKYGALPLAFEVSEVSNVSATLGGEQLRAGIIAGLIGLALVVAYAIFYYRGLFLVVVLSLGVAAAFTYAMTVLLGQSVGFALNLPGIAGAIVAIGLTADSFVIFFERIRDEVREGRSLRSAVEAGWARSKNTILISDAVTLLSAIVLFILAMGGIKGFAFILGLTTLLDLAVVFFFTKPLMSLLVRTKFFGDGHKLSGLDTEHLGVRTLSGRTSRRTPKVPVAAGKEA
ncbi:protein translocase subunit SecD [Granulicoccus sp. GXG6511]|uniref:protein translocase subunit SecD n=1 Tax=Granulicoccus sp. GXG6511 TaxID=3381351 RepID=UPI003D7D79BF